MLQWHSVFKKAEGNDRNIIQRCKLQFEHQTKLVKMENRMSEMKYTLDEINCRSNIGEEKIVHLKSELFKVKYRGK